MRKTQKRINKRKIIRKQQLDKRGRRPFLLAFSFYGPGPDFLEGKNGVVELSNSSCYPRLQMRERLDHQNRGAGRSDEKMKREIRRQRWGIEDDDWFGEERRQQSKAAAKRGQRKGIRLLVSGSWCMRWLMMVQDDEDWVKADVLKKERWARKSPINWVELNRRRKHRGGKGESV